MDVGDAAKTQDRDATNGLLKAVLDPETSGEDRDDAVDVLRAIEDPRIVDILLDAGSDANRPPEVRDAVLELLSAAGEAPKGDVLRSWWASDDSVLQRWALLLANRDEADIVAPVVDDPLHPLHLESIEAIEFGFDEPEWQQRKIRALAHESAAVRAMAADVLIWDEPVAAEAALVACTLDSDPSVRENAYSTLEYYPSRRLVAHLAEHREESCASELLDQFRAMYVDELRAASHYSPRGLQSFLKWMKPVAHLFQIKEEEMVFRPSEWSGAESATSHCSLDELLTQLDDLSGKWASRMEQLRAFDWASVIPERRSAVAQFLQCHVDAEVRSQACSALAVWHDTERLVELAHDKSGIVRKSAIYCLASVPQSDEVASLAWTLVESGSASSTHAQEALRTYAVHAPGVQVDDRCLTLIRSDRRESVRYEAVSSLSSERIAEVLYVLDQEPLVTWAVHSMVLAVCADQHLHPPQAASLWSVDNLQIAADLTALEEFRL